MFCILDAEKDVNSAVVSVYVIAMLDYVKLSLSWEELTGYDSIPTIERVYERTKSGAIICSCPSCSFARKDAKVIWRHVHTAHGKVTLPSSDWMQANG